MDWLQGMLQPLLTDLEKSINNAIGDLTKMIGFKGKIPIGLGQWSLFDLEVDLGITANVSLDPTPLFEMVRSLVLDGRSTLSLGSLSAFFDTVFSFFEISPQFRAQLGVKGLDTSKNSFMKYLMESIGVDLAFSGSAKFVLSLFTFRDGMFEWGNFFNILEWEFNVKITAKKDFTLLDFMTAGVGGGTLSKASKYLGLDGVKMTVALALSISILKKGATETTPEVSTMSVVLTLSATLRSGFDVSGATITLTGSLEISLTFFFDLASNAPMKITLA